MGIVLMEKEEKRLISQFEAQKRFTENALIYIQKRDPQSYEDLMRNVLSNRTIERAKSIQDVRALHLWDDDLSIVKNQEIIMSILLERQKKQEHLPNAPEVP
jgi:uncharacterized protein involved in tolerance to divalent cations